MDLCIEWNIVVTGTQQDWICGPCLGDINEDEDNTHINQLGEFVVPPLIVEPDVSVNIPVRTQIINNPPPIHGLLFIMPSRS